MQDISDAIYDNKHEIEVIRKGKKDENYSKRRIVKASNNNKNTSLNRTRQMEEL